MSESDTFCLRSDDFERNIKASWQELQAEPDFCDVTLACEDKQIKAHKVIISACSPVLMKILKLNPNEHPLIYLTGVKYEDLQKLINFMYQGEVNVAKEDLPSLLEVAEDLNIRGLAEANVEGYKSEVEQPKKATKKRKRTAENMTIESIKKPKYTDTLDYQTSDDFALDDTEGYEMVVNEENEMVENEHYSIETYNEQATEDFSIDDIEFESEAIKEEPLEEENDEDTNQSYVACFEEKKFNCGQCDKQYSSPQGLYDHTKTIHEGVRYPCDQCDYKARKKSQLKVHVSAMHECKSETIEEEPLQEDDDDTNQSYAVACFEEKRLWNCGQCDKQFSSNQGLSDHTKTIHEGVRYSCEWDQCMKIFRKKSQLKVHVESAHEGVRYPCNQCDYMATQKGHLRNHLLKSHSGQ